MTDDLATQLGLVIRKSRVTAGLSQEGLSVLAGLDRTYISSLERGRRNPTLSTQERIAAALSTSLSSLLKEAEDL